ncbi:MAG: hypothetical protein AB1445_08815 [Bacillota bacterium]
MFKTGCGPKADTLYALYHKRALELRKLARDWTTEEEADLVQLQILLLDELEAHFRREDRKQKRLARGGTWAES